MFTQTFRILSVSSVFSSGATSTPLPVHSYPAFNVLNNGRELETGLGTRPVVGSCGPRHEARIRMKPASEVSTSTM